MSVVLGVDIGTYESKGVLVDAQGRIRARHQRPQRVTVPHPGHVEHDPEHVWWGGFTEITGALLAASGTAPGEIAAVAVSGIGPCVLPLDRDDRPLRPAILYGVDARAQEQMDALTAHYGGQEILARSGTALTSQSAGPKISWIEQNEPEVFDRTARFVTCQTFLTGRLTGRWVTDRATAAYYHPFYDRRTDDWDLTGAPGRLTREQLPDLGWSCDVAGTVTAEAARATGLAEGTPVLVGAPDAAAEALSAGVTDDRDMMLMYGSSHFLIEILNEPRASRALWPAPYLFPGTYLLAGGTATAGSFTRWYADLLAPSGDGDALFGELAELAEQSPPGARGLLALPYLSGERTPLYDTGARGALLGLSLEHDRGDVARAIAESIAHSAAAALRSFAAEDVPPKRIRAVGGGTRNRAWVQAVSDISGHQQEVVAGPGAAYGDAMLAALAAGLVGDRRAPAGWSMPVTRIEPRPELAGFYARQRALFERFYRDTRPILTELNDLGTP